MSIAWQCGRSLVPLDHRNGSAQNPALREPRRVAGARFSFSTSALPQASPLCFVLAGEAQVSLTEPGGVHSLGPGKTFQPTAASGRKGVVPMVISSRAIVAIGLCPLGLALLVGPSLGQQSDTGVRRTASPTTQPPPRRCRR